jgi:hypothetical protein
VADAPDPITSPPSVIPGGYDAAEPSGTDHAAPWEKLPGGPVSFETGQLTGEDFPDGPGPWRQC